MSRNLLSTFAIWLLTSTALVAADKKAKILLIGKDLDHPRNTHTYMSDCELLAKCLHKTDGVETVVSNGWPKDPAVVKDVTAIVLHTRLGGTVLFRGPQRSRVEEMLKQGVGITAIHWGTGAETHEGGPWLQTMGGWFNAEGDGFSRYLVQTSRLRQADPKHPVCRGWSDFDLREEYYFKLCFLPEARPVMDTVIEGKNFPIGWVYERRHSKGGRSFGFVGGHFHDNFGLKGFRQAVVNGILWTAHIDIPENGAPISITSKDMELPPEQGTPPAVSTISDRMRQYIAAKEIAGAVTLVATRDRIIHLDATRNAVLNPESAMRTDSIFWIASMSKPVLATLLLMLQDKGLLSVDDPVEKYLPEFKGLKTVDGKPAQITIRHLLTHTSGMGEITGDQALACKTLASVIPLYVAKPVGFTPGSKWVYCQSAINTGGRIAEVVTGEPLEKLLQRRLFDPLGMKDTTFYLTEEQLLRLAKSYRRTDKGDLEATDIRFLNGKSPTSRDRFPAPNGGLFSTASDYARFCQMVLRDGELGGKRYLKPETVKLMTTIQTAGLQTGFTPGNGWGLGWCIVREPQGITAMLSPGSFGHGGAYGTQAWIDPGTKRIYILMVQRANFPNSDASEVRRGFQEAASRAFSNLNSK